MRSLGSHAVAGHVVKAYLMEAPGRVVTEQDARAALRIGADHLASAYLRGSLWLSVLLLHAGGDGDYVLVHTWIESYMFDLAVFTGPTGDIDALRPGRTGLAPCVWEAAVLAHERDAFSRHVLDGEGAVEAGWPPGAPTCRRARSVDRHPIRARAARAAHGTAVRRRARGRTRRLRKGVAAAC